MAIKKSQLYSSLWKSCDELRGGMDASQYKDYVLILLFIKYISDKAEAKEDALIEIPEGSSFKDLVKLKGKPTIGDDINKKIIAPIAKEYDLHGVIDVADFNDDVKLGKGKEMVDRLSNLIAIFENPVLNFKNNGSDNDDLLGDAYEYLMKHFASESGKSKGQFYTPSEVSKILAKVIEINKAERQDQTIYDPTCGSGSLLLKAAAEAPKRISIYGQEKDNATAILAKMNMILHDNETAEIWQDDTISTPYYKDENDSTKLKTFDFVVANPPFSTKSWTNGLKVYNSETKKDEIVDKYKRFEGYGMPPPKNGDYAFLLHIIKSLKSTGKGACILPHGVLFRGNAEADIRKNIIKRGYIKGIIGLPANLFYGTGIPACIIVIDKENANSRRGIFMIDASKGFYKDWNKNRLRSQDIHKIVDVFNKQIPVPKFSRMVDFEEIEKNEFNLNIPRYIDSQEEEDLQNISAHLLGGIPKKDIDDLEKYWKAYPNMKNSLFENGNRDGYFNVKVESINETIFEHEDFKKFSSIIEDIFRKWCIKHKTILKNLDRGCKPKEVIHELSEDLLKDFSNLVLIDRYDIYQQIMEYWAEIMQDDMYILSIDGWKAEVKRILVEDKNKKMKDKGWTCDLIPKELVINRFFQSEFTSLQQLKDSLEEVTSEMASIDEENSGDEDVFSDARNDKGNINAKELAKIIKKGELDKEELDVLKKYSALIDKEKDLKNKIKDLEVELDNKLLIKYPKLSVDEIKTLVVDDKWFTELDKRLQSELDRISQALTGRIKELVKRYETPLPEINKKVEDLTSTVDKHLEKMGFKW
jgi:type I restriction enzyme M protein